MHLKHRKEMFMVTPSVGHPSLAQAIFPRASWLRDLLLVVGGVIFVALLAQVRIVCRLRRFRSRVRRWG